MKKDELSKAVFRIGTHTDAWHDLGTCFLAPIYSLNDLNYNHIITAYHVIAEARIKGEQIFILDNIGNILPADIIYIPDKELLGQGYDCAILRARATIKVEPLPFGVEVHPGPVIIRGRPNGLDTEFAFVHGYCHGLEAVKSKSVQVLDLSFEAFYNSYVSIQGDKISAPHDIWRGMSGAPIAIAKTDNYDEILYVSGILTRLAKGAAGGRAYGVPVSFIVNVCKSSNLLVDIQKAKVDHKEGDDNIELLAIGDLLNGLENPQRERQLWDWLSRLFYRGVNSLELLTQIINHTDQLDLDICDLAFLRYFRGRLMLKEGKSHRGEIEIVKALNISKGASEITKSRIHALAKGRLAVESTSDNITERTVLLLEAKAAIERLQDIPTDYRIAEISSLLARQTASTFLKTEKLGAPHRSQLISLIQEHENLLNTYPFQLAKQDVVNTSLVALSLLWNIRRQGQISDELMELSTKGFEQSKRGKNSIFYIQMLIVKALSYWYYDNKLRSLKLLATAAKLLDSANLDLHHEGVSQLFHFMSINLPYCANFIYLSYNITKAPMSERIKAISTILPLADTINVERCAHEWLEDIHDWRSLYKYPHLTFES